MKFLLMIQTDEVASHARSEAEAEAIVAQHGETMQALREADQLVDAHRLEFSGHAKTLRRGGDGARSATPAP